jgi:hypothetical protein
MGTARNLEIAQQILEVMILLDLEEVQAIPSHLNCLTLLAAVAEVTGMALLVPELQD